MKINYLIHEFAPHFQEVLTPLKEFVDQSYDGNVFLNEMSEPQILKKIELHTRDIGLLLQERFHIKAKCIHWGFRNEKGRKIAPEGHIHVRSEAIFSAVTCLYGEGTWLDDQKERIVTKAGETVVLVEQRGYEQYPELFKSPINHGGPSGDDKRLIFLSSYEAY